MKEFIQEFKRVARGSGYEGRLLVEKFKRRMNRRIRRKLIEVENLLTSIKQWYKRAIALDRNWRESRKEKERLREKKEMMGEALKQEQRQDIKFLSRWDLYTMEIDRGRNCYACGDFGHIAYHCRNRGRGRPIEERKIEYDGGQIKEIFDNMNNLKGEENLELLN